MGKRPKPTTPPRISGLSYNNGKPFVSGVVLVAGTQYIITATVNTQTRSVKWNRDSGNAIQIDSAAPFDYTWTPTNVGAHTFVVTPYSLSSASGTAGPAVTINWTVKSATPPPPATASAFVSWTQVDTATGYKIFWGTSTTNYPYQADAGANLTLEVPNLTKGTPYYFSGKSYNQTQTSDYGNEVKFTP